MENNTEDNFVHGECRCCLARGKHKDILQEYNYNGVREVYYDIFLDTFNIMLSKAKDLTILICAHCIARLRDAQTFRAMAISTESHLLNMLRNNMVFVNVSQERSSDDVKQEVLVKEELSEDFVMEHGYDSDFLSADEYEISHPDLVRGEAALLARFSNVARLPTRADLSIAVPNFARHLEILKHVEMSSSKIIMQSARALVSRAGGGARGEKAAHVHNASTLIKYSNMTPFKSKHRSGYPCFYCRSVFEQFDDLKKHTQTHKHTELARVFKQFGLESLIVYADVTDLKCSICLKSTPSINELKSHLTNVHHKRIIQNISDRVIPFSVTESKLICQICCCRFETFGSIERHMNGHFRNYVCKECGSGYVTKYRLKVHQKSMHVNSIFPCETCDKIFRTRQKLNNHINAVHKMKKRFKCTKCAERFVEYFQRQKHMVEMHGSTPLKYTCNVCDRSFDRRYTLSRHMKRDHLEEREHECDICNYRCYTKNELKVHMIKHTGERIYECGVCKKAYARKKTLKEHMRIHNNDRRFVCPACGQAFVQKCSLKGHMKTHHFEYSLP